MTNHESELNDLYKTRIESLGLGYRAEKALRNGGVRTLGGIFRKGESGLLLIEGLGIKSIREIKEKTDRYKQMILGSNNSEPIASPSVEASTVYSADAGVIESVPALLEFEENDDIVSILAEHFSYSKDVIKSPSRKKEIVRVRDYIAYLLREYASMSYPVIGELLGGRDHTTIIHSYNKIKKLIAENPLVNAEISELTDKVKSIKDKKERIEKTIAQQILVFAEAEKIRRKGMVFKEISERDMKILELYREGLTLRNISEFFGITHERIRQIVIMAIKRLAVNDSITRGIQLDPEIVLEEEFKKRNNAKLKKKPIIIQTPKEIRWSRYYITCKSCGLTTYPHVRKGLCEKCVGGYRDDRREHIIIEHGNKCDSCGIAREQAISVYNRDLYITKTQNVFCKKCFLLNSGRILGQSSKNRRNKTFS